MNLLSPDKARLIFHLTAVGAGAVLAGCAPPVSVISEVRPVALRDPTLAPTTQSPVKSAEKALPIDTFIANTLSVSPELKKRQGAIFNKLLRMASALESRGVTKDAIRTMFSNVKVRLSPNPQIGYYDTSTDTILVPDIDGAEQLAAVESTRRLGFLMTNTDYPLKLNEAMAAYIEQFLDNQISAKTKVTLPRKTANRCNYTDDNPYPADSGIPRLNYVFSVILSNASQNRDQEPIVVLLNLMQELGQYQSGQKFRQVQLQKVADGLVNHYGVSKHFIVKALEDAGLMDCFVEPISSNLPERSLKKNSRVRLLPPPDYRGITV